MHSRRWALWATLVMLVMVLLVLSMPGLRWERWAALGVGMGAVGAIGWLASFGNTYDAGNSKQNLVSGHAFMLLGYDAGTDLFTVRNPWGGTGGGYNAQFTVTIGDFWNSTVKGIDVIIRAFSGGRGWCGGSGAVHGQSLGQLGLRGGRVGSSRELRCGWAAWVHCRVAHDHWC